MKPEDVVMVGRKGEIRIGKKATESLGISGWKWLAVRIEGDCIFMRICKSSSMETGDRLIRLRDKSSGLRGACLEFAKRINFGHSDSLDLQFKTVSTDSDECVMLRIDGESMMESEEKVEASEEVAAKDRQADICREIVKRKTCANISCGGSSGKFAGTECPLDSHGKCGSKSAKDWLTCNGYHPYPEENLGTVSKPAEQQLDIFNLPGSKAGRAPQTRPLPEGLPEWLRGPLSRGEQVRVVAFKAEGNSSNEGWVSGAFIDTAFGKDRPVAIIRLDFRTEPSFILVEAIKPCLPCLKPAAECLAVAKELGIGLSPLQVSLVINGGVPPEGHGLPDEMFE